MFDFLPAQYELKAQPLISTRVTTDPAEEEPGQAGPSLPAVELPRKRKGVVEEKLDAHVQQRLDLQMEDDLSRYTHLVSLI
ncbi:hypothetical protein INR49_004117 [Caranx melampygus]|nr:hypothetical protein INR49_004117 [Caranx melampygus]